MEWKLDQVKITDDSFCKIIKFYNYRIVLSELEINSINGRNRLLRAIIYKNEYIDDIKVAFEESDLQLQVFNYFNRKNE